MEATLLSNTTSTSTLTCLTCNSLFSDRKEQREHYKSEWHRYNLKRKITGLQSISEFEYNEIYGNNNKKCTKWKCVLCNKIFNSENSFKNHEISRKHIENMTIFEKQDISDASDYELVKNNSNKKMLDWKKKYTIIKTHEFNTSHEKTNLGKKIDETECLFCSFNGQTFEEKMKHMTEEHTFFVPDIEYIINLKDLIDYLSEEIGIHHTCIYCEKKFHSLEAIRKHMLSKGHTKINYENGPNKDIGQFYDFSSLNDINDDENEEYLEIFNPQALTVTSEGTELILPSGAHIGHRDYKRYYNQNLRERDHSNSMALMPLSEKYKALGYYEIGSSGMTIEKERLEKMKAARVDLKSYSKERQIMGQKTNDFYVAWGRLGQFKNLFLM